MPINLCVCNSFTAVRRDLDDILPSIFSSENELEWTGSLFLPPFLLNISPLFLFVSLSIKLPTVALTTLH